MSELDCETPLDFNDFTDPNLAKIRSEYPFNRKVPKLQEAPVLRKQFTVRDRVDVYEKKIGLSRSFSVPAVL